MTAMYTRIAIIGTAGRNEDASKMNARVFARMVEHAEHVQRTLTQASARDIRSGIRR
jgi:hypothetical protein